MKVVKVENFKTKQFYFASVDDNDNRLDPQKKFSDSFSDNDDRLHKTLNVNRTVIKQHCSPEQASVEVIIQKKKHPLALNNTPVEEIKPIENVIITKEPEVIIKDEIDYSVITEMLEEKPTSFGKSKNKNKEINN